MLYWRTDAAEWPKVNCLTQLYADVLYAVY